MPYDVTMPDGTVIHDVPDGTTKAELQRRYNNSKKDTSFWQGLAEGVAHQGSNALNFMGKLNPVANTVQTIADLTGHGRSIPTPKNASRTIKSEVRNAGDRSKYRGSTAGRITGEILSTVPLMFVPGGGFTQGALAGAMSTDNPDDIRSVARDAAIGAVTGKVGDELGKRVVAPVVRRVAAAKPVQTVANAARRAVGKGAQVVPKLSATDKAVQRMAPDLAPVQQNLEDAARLGLPYSLADASPELRNLSGSVSRKSGDAAALAESTFGPRSLGQAERATQGIDDLLAPITNIEERSGALRNTARAVSQPHYDRAFAQAMPDDPEINAILQSPAGKEAFARAKQIMANEGVDPSDSFRVLDYVKRGFDSVLNDSRSPLTGKLNLEGDPVSSSVNGILQRFKVRLDQINPDYAAARSAYQEAIAPRTALQTGYGPLAKPNLPLRQFDEGLQAIAPENLGEAQRGYATALADRISNVSERSNPYSRVYGSPNNQAKVASMFPGGADDFARQAQLEADMSKTAWETLGGSPTQKRAMADQLFDTNIANYGQAALDMATGGKLGALRLGGRKLKDLLVTRGEKKAAEMAPVLFNTDPQAGLSYLSDMALRQAAIEARNQAYAKTLGELFGLPAAVGGVAAFPQSP